MKCVGSTRMSLLEEVTYASSKVDKTPIHLILALTRILANRQGVLPKLG